MKKPRVRVASDEEIHRLIIRIMKAAHSENYGPADTATKLTALTHALANTLAAAVNVGGFDHQGLLDNCLRDVTELTNRGIAEHQSKTATKQ